MKSFPKQPGDTLDYDIDASEWLTQGDNLTGSVVTVDDQSLTIGNTVLSDDRLKIWLSGGIDLTNYKITAKLNTEDGRTKEIDFQIRVKEL
jgi:hypothetical protein